MSDTDHNVIEGASDVVTYYGGWPTFHEADVVTVCVDMRGPKVTINFRLYDWEENLHSSHRPSLTLCWHKVEELTLSGIEQLGQNMVSELKIIRTEQGIATLISPEWDDERQEWFGTRADIRANRLEVIHFDPHEEWHYETSNTASD